MLSERLLELSGKITETRNVRAVFAVTHFLTLLRFSSIYFL